ncbi:hypothetical protein KI688_007683 [Linnemannia hyalina]|uniref:Galactose oxidase n=1 Tax=Linnemannia hyalina TaxID=64524 RepID=A0A9P7XII0_9FUNG|nr:hypothetical protein KI688_007683 [Linnemannia hyalina]
MTQWFNRPAAYTPTLLLLSLCLLLTLSTHHLTLAQTYYTPIVVFSAAIARTVTELYVIGGAAGANPGIRVPQLVSLDLNTSWNTTYPAWTKHADGPKQDLFPAAFSSDEKILYVFHLPDTSSPFQWDSNTEVWKEMTNVKFDNATWQGIGAVTDPRTGLIYMAGGYNDDTNLSDDRTYLAMDVFDPVSETLNRTHFTMPPDVVSEFKPDTQTWALMATTGTTPAMRSDHCMVSSEDGSKVLIYGGRLDNTTVVGDIFILDTATQTWTPGAVGPPRMYPACAVAGDQLVIWGGKAADNVEPPRELIIYNFVTGQQEESHPVSEEAELQRTLQELQDLENQQQELERKRLQLIRQQQVPYPPPPPLAPGQLRRPSEYSEPLSDYRPPPNNPEFTIIYRSSTDFPVMTWTRQSAAQRFLAWPSILTVLCLVSVLSTQRLTYAQAQNFIPTVVTAPAFARTITKLYVASGALTANLDSRTHQFMYLDLLKPFTSTTPPWTQLANGPVQRLFPAAFSSDEKILYVFHVPGTNSPWQYSVADDTWQEVTAAKFGNADWEGIGAVTDPKSGLIYLAGGYDDVNAKAASMKIVNIFDPVSETINTQDLPPPDKVFPIRWYYGNVWSRNRSSAVYWGGINRDYKVAVSPVENGVTEFSPDPMSWFTMPIQGVPPVVRVDHCMTAIIYGGRFRNWTVSGELWILDLVTYSWTQGLSGPPRYYSACTIAGDQFLVWGGSVSLTEIVSSEMLIYDMKGGKWVKEYTPPPFYKDLLPPPALRRVTAPWPTKTLTGGARSDGGSGGMDGEQKRQLLMLKQQGLTTNTTTTTTTSSPDLVSSEQPRQVENDGDYAGGHNSKQYVIKFASTWSPFGTTDRGIKDHIIVSAPAFTRTITKLYVAGGTTSATAHVNTQQFMFLDLLVPFTSTAPAWTLLANCPAQRSFPAAFSSDEKILYIFRVPGTNSPWKYSVADNTWQEVTAAKFGDAEWEGIGAVTDPKSGLIFLAGGYDDINFKVPYMKIFNTFDPVSETIHTDDLPPPERVFPIRWSYKNVWCKTRSSILYWGGINRDGQAPFSPVENGVTEFSPSLMGWYTMGSSPEVRTDHCMTTNDDGTKVVVYGGWVRNGTIVGELWILDVVASTWTQGRSGPPRIYCACTIAGDQLLIWGGSSASKVMAPSEMLIYNLVSSEYVKQYTPPAYYKDLLPPPALRRVTAPWPTKTLTGGAVAGSGGADGGDGKGSGATREETNSAIIGGAIGGVFLLGAFAGIFFLRRRQHRRQEQGSSAVTGVSQAGQGGDGGGFAERAQWKGPQGVAIKNDPQAVEQDYSHVDRTLQELVEQQRQLEQKRQLLMLKQKGLTTNTTTTSPDQVSSEQPRAPAVLTHTKSEYHHPPPSSTSSSSPTPPLPMSSTPTFNPETLYADLLLSTAGLTTKPTVQVVPGLVVYDGDYADEYEGAHPGTGARK